MTFPGRAHWDWLSEPDETRPEPPSVGSEYRPPVGRAYCPACNTLGPDRLCCLRCGRVPDGGLGADVRSRYVLYYRDHCYACGQDVIVRRDSGTFRPPMVCRVCGSRDVGRFTAKEEERKEERRRAANSGGW